MSKSVNVCICGLLLVLGWTLHARPHGPSSTPQAPAVAAQSTVPPSASAAIDTRAVVKRYCVSCHNQRLKTGGLTLDLMDVDRVGEHAASWEKVVKKLRAGSMPPVGLPRPDATTVETIATTLEAALDRAAAATPNPGSPTIHRLNRSEYANAIRDLVVLEIDGREMLPPDDADLGFDNMADILSASPAFLDRAIVAARKISRLAVGDPTIAPSTETHVVPPMRFQDDRMDEELPFGSRGGIAIRHHFPLDADYVVTLRLQRQIYAYIRGLQKPQQLEIRLDGRRIHTFTVGGHVPGTPAPASFAGDIQSDREWEDYTLHADDHLEVKFHAKAGPGLIGVSFVQGRSERDGVLQPRPITKLLSLSQNWSSPSEAPEAALESVVVSGPFNPSGASETASRRRIFICRPAAPAQEEPCARRILSSLATRAFRRPATERDAATAMGFYKAGRTGGDFEAGIQRGLESILVDPEFMFRVERDPEGTTAGTPYRISDLELASRLSFFLWSSIPDDELLAIAGRGDLKKPDVLAQQTLRMLSDRRSKALVDNFVTQWLSLRRLPGVGPTPELYPEFDDNLRDAFQRETELFVEHQLRTDRSVLDLLFADYTYVNERLARHYGIEGVSGSRFRQIKLADSRRGGILGHGSILTVTSYPTRTSPVVRGHWLLENILGAPPPPPPPNIPGLPERGEGGQPASVRERLEAHRKNPVCAACHAPMDPLGFALENFDAIGMWRTTGEGGDPIDASGVFPSGASFDGLAGLKTVLRSHDRELVATITEKLLTYGLGRGLEYYDMPTVRQILRDAAVEDYRWSALIQGIVKSAPFQMRRSQS